MSKNNQDDYYKIFEDTQTKSIDLDDDDHEDISVYLNNNIPKRVKSSNTAKISLSKPKQRKFTELKDKFSKDKLIYVAQWLIVIAIICSPIIVIILEEATSMINNDYSLPQIDTSNYTQDINHSLPQIDTSNYTKNINVPEISLQHSPIEITSYFEDNHTKIDGYNKSPTRDCSFIYSPYGEYTREIYSTSFDYIKHTEYYRPYCYITKEGSKVTLSLMAINDNFEDNYNFIYDVITYATGETELVPNTLDVIPKKGDDLHYESISSFEESGIGLSFSNCVNNNNFACTNVNLEFNIIHEPNESDTELYPLNTTSLEENMRSIFILVTSKCSDFNNTDNFIQQKIDSVKEDIICNIQAFEEEYANCFEYSTLNFDFSDNFESMQLDVQSYDDNRYTYINTDDLKSIYISYNFFVNDTSHTVQDKTSVDITYYDIDNDSILQKKSNFDKMIDFSIDRNIVNLDYIYYKANYKLD